MITQVVGAFVGTILFGVFFNTSRYELIICGVNGAIAWIVYLVMMRFFESAVIASFMAALIVCVIAQILARIRKNPVTIYQIAGIIPLVPGVGLYQALYYGVIKDYQTSFNHLVMAIQIASAIAVAMLLVTTINKAIINKENI